LPKPLVRGVVYFRSNSYNC